MRHATRGRRKERHVSPTVFLEAELAVADGFTNLVVADDQFLGEWRSGTVDLTPPPGGQLGWRRGVVPVNVDNHGLTQPHSDSTSVVTCPRQS